MIYKVSKIVSSTTTNEDFQPIINSLLQDAREKYDDTFKAIIKLTQIDSEYNLITLMCEV